MIKYILVVDYQKQFFGNLATYGSSGIISKTRSTFTKVSILDVFCSCVEYESTIGVHVLAVCSLDVKCQPLGIVKPLSHPEVD